MTRIGQELPTAAPFVPDDGSLSALREAAASCRGCKLWAQATRTVFGEGTAGARLFVIGEQPGNDEDLTGRPFVGPAGRILDRALDLAGIERGEVYVTNAVKHFKWTPQGKRRLHKKPSAREIEACLPWLEAEAAAVGPELLVCLGATAAQAVLGRLVRIGAERGQIQSSRFGIPALVTAHPSAALRARDPARRRAELARLAVDLGTARP